MKNLVLALAVTALAAACSSSKPPPGPGPLPPNVRRHPDGSCWFYPPVNCPPPPVTCEAVPPQRVQCPR